jgi:hypothetical protein
LGTTPERLLDVSAHQADPNRRWRGIRVTWHLWLRVVQANYLVALSFSILGFATGYITGLSREPVAHMILPAVLSLIASVAIYWVAKEENQRHLVLLSVLSLSTMLLIGTMWGARQRLSLELYRESADFLKWQIDRDADLLVHKAQRQAQIDEYLKDLENYRTKNDLPYYDLEVICGRKPP